MDRFSHAIAIFFQKPSATPSDFHILMFPPKRLPTCVCCLIFQRMGIFTWSPRHQRLTTPTLCTIYLFMAAIPSVSFNSLQAGYFSYFCPLLIVFPNQLFRKKNLSEIPPECQIVWICIRPEVLSALIWTRTVSNGYQQTTGKELCIDMTVHEILVQIAKASN